MRGCWLSVTEAMDSSVSSSYAVPAVPEGGVSGWTSFPSAANPLTALRLNAESLDGAGEVIEDVARLERTVDAIRIDDDGLEVEIDD